ncbi:MAG TPA: high-potential iron-sulfur protein [Candidatus Rubrimentiphilum sp.]|nr:high-potential iron-sulfur protein [Candidatus Rubrimentiphilum sp.]
MDHENKNVSRGEALKALVVLPALAGLLAAGSFSTADAADNKKQFHYQDKPGPGGRKCSGCRFFRRPNACSIVHGKISPNGWCIAWAKR